MFRARTPSKIALFAFCSAFAIASPAYADFPMGLMLPRMSKEYGLAVALVIAIEALAIHRIFELNFQRSIWSSVVANLSSALFFFMLTWKGYSMHPSTSGSYYSWPIILFNSAIVILSPIIDSIFELLVIKSLFQFNLTIKKLTYFSLVNALTMFFLLYILSAF